MSSSSVELPKVIKCPPDMSDSLCFSLAGSYLLAVSLTKDKEALCQFYQLSELKSKTDKAFQHSEGALAWSCLMHGKNAMEGSPAVNEIRVLTTGENKLEVSIQNSDEHHELAIVLSRILVQLAITNRTVDSNEKEWTVSWADKDSAQPCRIQGSWNDDQLMQSIFQGIHEVVPGQTELVEMVDQNGRAIGQVPRKLVHQFNILHRGIGLFVTKDRPIEQSIHGSQNQPSLYVHQRTSTKRIFPSLYDMFVGGVSLANEPAKLTAQREVAEELGLSRGADHLSDCLWTCVVCTAYNRCVVDFFSYTMKSDIEQVSWQEEEVAWGAFVPYKVVESSADLSIQRLAQRNEWPGRYPPIQANSNMDSDEIARPIPAKGDTKLECWDEWDYVPDGLLVWEAWLEKGNSQSE